MNSKNTILKIFGLNRSVGPSHLDWFVPRRNTRVTILKLKENIRLNFLSNHFK